jgi:hypothetical protein
LQSRSRIYITEEWQNKEGGVIITRVCQAHVHIKPGRCCTTPTSVRRLRLGPGTRKQMPVYKPCRIFGTHDQTQLICPSRPSHGQLFQSKEAHQRLNLQAMQSLNTLLSITVLPPLGQKHRIAQAAQLLPFISEIYSRAYLQ